MNRRRTAAIVVLALLALCGCGSHPQRCTGPLQPINLVTPRAEGADER